MLSHYEIAKALLIESYNDLKAAHVLMEAGIYARCIAHCQQSVEKVLKSALAVRNVIITDRHDISEDFQQTYNDWHLCNDLVKMAINMENVGFRAEYPLFGRRNMPIWIPSEQYTKIDAQKALNDADNTFKIISSFLASDHKITINL
jgi:HEPN domain-containing protein